MEILQDFFSSNVNIFELLSIYKEAKNINCSNIMHDIIETYQNDRSKKNEYKLNIENIRNLSDSTERKQFGKKICIYCFESESIGYWDPDSIKTGIPGSEEAVIYISKELASVGYDVTVEANPPSESIWSNKHSNPRYIKTNLTDVYDIIIVWRRTECPKDKAKKTIAWLHDLPDFHHDFRIKNLDHVFLLSEYQHSLFKNYLEVPHTICGNGVLTNDFQHPMMFKNKYSCGYFSNYSRGLEIVLYIWPFIKRQYPEATLDIFYGRQNYANLRPDQLESLVEKIESLSHLDVRERGRIGHKELANEMCNLSIWLYPCSNYTETFCITAIKAQLAGMIPITTRLGALNETISEDAFTVDTIFDSYSIQKYQSLVEYVMQNIDQLQERRMKYIEFAKKFTWKQCLKKWEDVFNLPNNNQIIEVPSQPEIKKSEIKYIKNNDILIVLFLHNCSKKLTSCLESISKIQYPKNKMRFYIRCYNNDDETETIIKRWKDINQEIYRSVFLDTGMMFDTCLNLMHEKNRSVKYAIENDCDYFYLSPNCTVIPSIFHSLYKNKLNILVPLIRTNDSTYSNFILEIDHNGFFADPSCLYISILERIIKGTIEIKSFKYCYLINLSCLEDCIYDKSVNYYDFMDFTQHLRGLGYQFYLDNNEVYGHLN